MKKLSITLLLGVLALFGTGCASVFKGNSDNISFQSDPSGATVLLNGMKVGKTPILIPVKKSISAPTVTYQLDGYEDQTVQLQNSFDPIAILNVLFWPGLIIDAATGSVMQYNPKIYQVDLSR